MLFIAAQLSDSDEDSEDFFTVAQSAEDKVPWENLLMFPFDLEADCSLHLVSSPICVEHHGDVSEQASFEGQVVERMRKDGDSYGKLIT